jgi:hypothetical protein
MSENTRHHLATPNTLERVILPNGLKATVLPTDSHGLSQLLRRCANAKKLFLNSRSMFALKVRVDGDLLYVIYWRGLNFEPHIRNLVEIDLKFALEQNSYIIYHNTAYSCIKKTNAIFIDSIIQKVKPGVAALLGGKT